jgi:hypothetical protein
MGLLSGLHGRAPSALAASRRFAAQVPKTVEPTQVSMMVVFLVDLQAQ